MSTASPSKYKSRGTSTTEDRADDAVKSSQQARLDRIRKARNVHDSLSVVAKTPSHIRFVVSSLKELVWALFERDMLEGFTNDDNWVMSDVPICDFEGPYEDDDVKDEVVKVLLDVFSNASARPVIVDFLFPGIDYMSYTAGSCMSVSIGVVRGAPIKFKRPSEEQTTFLKAVAVWNLRNMHHKDPDNFRGYTIQDVIDEFLKPTEIYKSMAKLDRDGKVAAATTFWWDECGGVLTWVLE